MMFYVPGEAPPALERDPFKAIVVPRPIGWISTLNPDGSVNIGSYSFFNGIAERPPCIMYASTGRGPSGNGKDSLRNIERTGEFVVNFASADLRDEVRRSGTPLPYGESELAMVGLTCAPSLKVKTPRLAEVRAALECRWLQSIAVPGTSGLHQTHVVFGEVVAIYVSDEVLVDGIVAPARLRPLCRLGYNHYAVVEQVFHMDVPQ